MIALATGNGERVWKKSHVKYGKVVRLGPNVVSIGSNEGARKIFSSHKYRKLYYYDILVFLVPDTISTRDPVENSMRRRQIGPPLSEASVRKMEPKILERGALALRRKFEAMVLHNKDKSGGDASAVSGCEINYCFEFALATFDVIQSLGLGEHVNGVKDDVNYVTQLMREYTQYIAIYFAFPWIKRFEDYIPPIRKNRQQIKAMAQMALEKRRHEYSESSSRANDILDGFLGSVDAKTGRGMTEDELISELALLFIAGTETTGISLTWIFHLLMLYPAVRAEIVGQLRAAFPDRAVPTTYQEVCAQVPLLVAVVYEGMRLCPASGNTLGRVAPPGGATIEGFYFPAGTPLYVNIATCNIDKDVFENPTSFMPSRFMSADAKKLQSSVLTFSTGVRICPGRHLAWVEMVSILSNLLRDFDFEITDDSLFSPTVTDPERNFEPKIMPESVLLVKTPRFPARDCRVNAYPAVF